MEIELGTLKDSGEELATFLEPRVGAKPALSGDKITVDDGAVRSGVRPRHVKTYIKRFLHSKGLRKKYRVLVQGKQLTIQELEGAPEEVKEEKQAEEKAPGKEEGAQAEKEEKKKVPKKRQTKKKEES
jgi:hypothetical protein